MLLGGAPLSPGARYVGLSHMVALAYATFSTNMALLSKWVIRVMKPFSDMVSMLLREAYRHSLDWSVWATLHRGDSPIVAGLQGTLLLVRPFFRSHLGDGEHFRFLEDDWFGLGCLGDAFPRPALHSSTGPGSHSSNNVD